MLTTTSYCLILFTFPYSSVMKHLPTTYLRFWDTRVFIIYDFNPLVFLFFIELLRLWVPFLSPSSFHSSCSVTGLRSRARSPTAIEQRIQSCPLLHPKCQPHYSFSFSRIPEFCTAFPFGFPLSLDWYGPYGHLFLIRSYLPMWDFAFLLGLCIACGLVGQNLGFPRFGMATSK